MAESLRGYSLTFELHSVKISDICRGCFHFYQPEHLSSHQKTAKVDFHVVFMEK